MGSCSCATMRVSSSQSSFFVLVRHGYDSKNLLLDCASAILLEICECCWGVFLGTLLFFLSMQPKNEDYQEHHAVTHRSPLIHKPAYPTAVRYVGSPKSFQRGTELRGWPLRLLTQKQVTRITATTDRTHLRNHSSTALAWKQLASSQI
jgi:hypothetical protein